MEIIVGIFPSFNVQDALLWGSRPLCFHELTSDLLEDCININSTTLQNEIKALVCANTKLSISFYTEPSNSKTQRHPSGPVFMYLVTEIFANQPRGCWFTTRFH